MSRLKRLISRLRGKPEEENELDTSDISSGETTETKSLETTESVKSVNPTPPPNGTLVASQKGMLIDQEITTELAERAKISRQRVEEIVPGRSIRRDGQGRVHIKIVFYGPSLSGKTTALRWLFANVRSLSKGKIVEIADELGRTTFFDFVPIAANEKIVFDVFTVAGQRRHAQSRITVLRDVDGLIFMADSQPEQMNENLASIQELRIALGTDRLATMPIVVALNKRDLPNALPIDYMVRMLDLEGLPVFPTIATEGKNLLKMFQRLLRDALIFKIGI
ncbi:MAG: hypothetical protein BAJATHORv1_10306 [Candidatus Thorarchaeota archaeon]|nr:MAG: hypothetical protein BAJATHORv1_10306 [Candidatus Thorarchaeota archaeon]